MVQSVSGPQLPPLPPDLLPPSGLHVLRVEEGELEIRWDQPHPSPVPVTGFAITYAPLAAGAGGGGRGGRQTDFLDRQQSSHLLQGLTPGELYNISTFSIKRNANSNDISQPAVALIRTREWGWGGGGPGWRWGWARVGVGVGGGGAGRQEW